MFHSPIAKRIGFHYALDRIFQGVIEHSARSRPVPELEESGVLSGESEQSSHVAQDENDNVCDHRDSRMPVKFEPRKSPKVAHGRQARKPPVSA